MDVVLLRELVEAAKADGISRLVVGGVVQYAGDVLLLRRHADDFLGGLWELPSGVVETGEYLDVALYREVREEVGLDLIAMTHFLGSFDYQSGHGEPTRQFNFAGTLRSSGPIELQEHDAYLWLSPGEDAPVTEAVKIVLSEYRRLQTR